tara:strand:- start:38 stop:235 length:198 start_codon:yes stop_codon:yes gene_type:complete
LQLDQYSEQVLAPVLVQALVLVLVLVLVQVLVQNFRLRPHRMNKVLLRIVLQIDVVEIALPKCKV